ncbi:hypothetical protein [Aliamphritea spongicola]|nr:hypothetical protein [Aliamphritea spongicola]
MAFLLISLPLLPGEVYMYLEWAWVLFKVMLGIWIISFVARPFVSSEDQEKLRMVDIFIADKINSIPIKLLNLWLLIGTVLYFIGNFTVLILLSLGVFMFGYSVFLHADLIELNLESIYNLAKLLVNEKVTWSSATIIVATTVAIGHMWKLNLDKRQYFEKKKRIS